MVSNNDSSLRASDELSPHPDANVSRQSGRWLRVITVMMLVLVVALVGVIQIPKQRKKADRSEAMSNLRSVFYLTIEFDGDYGEFPGDATATDTLRHCRGEFSNDYLRQFLVAGYTRSEEVFYAKRAGARRPDNAKPWIGAGECGYALIIGQSSRNHHETPLMMAPMVPGALYFDHEPYLGHAVILRVDGSSKSYKLNDQGEAMVGGGTTLFEGEKGTVWGAGGFDRSKLKYPE